MKVKDERKDERSQKLLQKTNQTRVTGPTISSQMKLCLLLMRVLFSRNSRQCVLLPLFSFSSLSTFTFTIDTTSLKMQSAEQVLNLFSHICNSLEMLSVINHLNTSSFNSIPQDGYDFPYFRNLNSRTRVRTNKNFTSHLHGLSIRGL